jgi:hypothetical protein
LRGVLPKNSVALCVLLWAKEHNAKDIHIEMFPLYGGKCLSRKVVHNWFEKSQPWCKRFADEEVETEVRKWLRQQSKYFCAAGFDTVVKRLDKCTNVGGGCVEKQMFFPSSNITCFTFHIHL